MSTARVDRGAFDLAAYVPHGVAYSSQQARVVERFSTWLRTDVCVEMSCDSLLLAPRLLALLSYLYGLHLFKTCESLYSYLCLLNAFGRREPTVKPWLARSWQLAGDWRAAEPVVHRPPLPVAIFRAMLVGALLNGWTRWAGCAALAFLGPGRIGEILRSVRRALVLPIDNLCDVPDRTFLHIAAPKSGRRGGAVTQHITVVGIMWAQFFTVCFGALGPGEPLWPFSDGAFRTRWDALLAALQVDASLGLKPGGLRGGGTVALYTRDVPIDVIMWKLRVKQQQTLAHYLQEVTALTTLRSLSETSRAQIKATSLLLSPVLRTLCGSIVDPSFGWPVI